MACFQVYITCIGCLLVDGSGDLLSKCPGFAWDLVCLLSKFHPIRKNLFKIIDSSYTTYWSSLCPRMAYKVLENLLAEGWQIPTPLYACERLNCDRNEISMIFQFHLQFCNYLLSHNNDYNSYWNFYFINALLIQWELWIKKSKKFCSNMCSNTYFLTNWIVLNN